MSKFLVINFDRYDTTKSEYQHIDAINFEGALKRSIDASINDSVQQDNEFKFCMNVYEQVSDSFACVPMEESDILIYKL